MKKTRGRSGDLTGSLAIMTDALEDELGKAEELLAAGDVPAMIKHLRFKGDAIPLPAIVRLIGTSAEQAGYDDLAESATAVQSAPQDPQALYDFGYACIERGIAFLAIRPLTEALALAPDALDVLSELVVALEHDGRHSQAVTVLHDYDGRLTWPGRFQYVYNSILAGDLATAEEQFTRLPVPEDDGWLPAREKVRTMLVRSAEARTVSSLDSRDLRGWHFALTGGILTGLSVWGFDAGMNGRWAYLGDSYEECAESLRRLSVILAASGRRPKTVSLLPDRPSQILGLAASTILGLPTAPFDPGRTDTVVIAYDLNDCDPQTLAALRDRAPGQILYERATCWTDPPTVSADVSGLLHQTVVAPWDPSMRIDENRKAVRTPADERPAEAIAAELATMPPAQPDGDGDTPPDTDEVLIRFAAAVADVWLTGVREYVKASGPVTSSRFL